MRDIDIGLFLKSVKFLIQNKTESHHYFYKITDINHYYCVSLLPHSKSSKDEEKNDRSMQKAT